MVKHGSKNVIIAACGIIMVLFPASTFCCGLLAHMKQERRMPQRQAALKLETAVRHGVFDLHRFVA